MSKVQHKSLVLFNVFFANPIDLPVLVYQRELSMNLKKSNNLLACQSWTLATYLMNICWKKEACLTELTFVSAS